jgi:hypothetical protein
MSDRSLRTVSCRLEIMRKILQVLIGVTQKVWHICEKAIAGVGRRDAREERNLHKGVVEGACNPLVVG